MTAPYSMDLRWRIVRACERGTQSQREVAEAFEVSLATVENLLRRYRQTGDVAPQARRVQTPALLNAADREQLRHWVQAQPDATLGELREQLVKDRGVEVSTPTLCRVLQQLGLRRKKRRFMPASGTQ